MYASDITHRKRSQAVYRNLELQKEWFNSGGTIRILGQKGGNDYSYMNEVQEGLIADTCWKFKIPRSISSGNGPISSSVANMNSVDFFNTTDGSLPNYIYDAGYDGGLLPLAGVIDDASIPIPMSGMDFYFDRINYGATNGIYWNTNNAITFGSAFDSNVVSFSANTTRAILLGNYDRLCSNLYSSTYPSGDGSCIITRIVVSFSNNYTDRTDFNAGNMQIRLIKELTGSMRQWVEVGIISSVLDPGYSNDPTVTYQSGSLDSNGDPIDPTKDSPWDITNGIRFLNITGNIYSKVFPAAGTTMVYQSDDTGTNWTFTNNSSVKIY